MIFYHGIPTGLNAVDEHAVYWQRHVMVSYATCPNSADRWTAFAASAALDNGAFSAWSSGVPFDEKGFYAWLETALLPQVDWFLIPDVIGGSEAQNDEMLRRVPEWCAKWAMPVWHLHESLERLLRLHDNFGQVALGSSAEYSHPKTARWWDRMHDVWTALPHRARVHGLRMGDPEITETFPFKSVDCTTAGRNSGMTSRWKTTVLARARKATRCQAYCEHLESAQVPLYYGGRPSVGR